MEETRTAILECLKDHAEDDCRLISALQLLLQEQGSNSYATLFNVLTNLDLDPAESEACWNEVVLHWENLCATLGRKINIRTALCDYFCSINKALHNPKVIEIHLFEKTDRRSKYDNLTNLFNRHYFEEILNRELARAMRHDSKLSLLLIDLDDFKVVNDEHGHQAGDAVLQNIAAMIMECKRTEDIACRYGGEELVLILPETDKLSGLVLGERIRDKIGRSVTVFQQHNIKLTISGGVATFPHDADTADLLIKRADSALYHAKASGKNIIASYSLNSRRFLRISFTKALEVNLVRGKQGDGLTVDGKDLSVGGILFASTSPFALGDNLRLSLPIKHEAPLILTGRVVRVERLDDARYDIGVSFLKPEKPVTDEISTYIMRQLTELAARSPGTGLEI